MKNLAQILQFASTQPPARARAIVAEVVAKQAESQNAPLAAAFERDMEPVCNALVSALQAGDLEALQGLRALLPSLLEEVNREPELADLLALQLGREILAGMAATREEMK